MASRRLKIAFLNDLVEDPDTCRCSDDPDEPACASLRHILQDCAGVPIIDTQLHWANPGGPDGGKAVCKDGSSRTDCTGNYSYVYDGPIPNVAHVHGAHADPESDGYTEAWFLPKLNVDNQTGYAKGGNFFDTFTTTFMATQICLEGRNIGLEANTYRNDQPTSTLFFHDHSLGLTRLNVMATR